MLPDLNTVLKLRDRKYRSIARHLTDYMLTTEENGSPYSEKELFKDLTASRGTNRFLGVFSIRGIHLALVNFGIYDKLKKRGLAEPDLEVDTSDAYKHRLRVTHNQNGTGLLSIETVLRCASLNLPALEGQFPEKYDFIVVEWFLLQNELKNFSRSRPQLPGQEYPGLGVSTLIFEVLYWTGRRLQVDGILFIPNYLHTALFYGRNMLMLDPKRQAELYAFDKMLRSRVKIDQLTWACAEGHLIDRTRMEPYLWIPAPITIPVSHRFKDRFHSPGYAIEAHTLSKKLNYRITPGYRKKYNSEWKSAR